MHPPGRQGSVTTLASTPRLGTSAGQEDPLLRKRLHMTGAEGLGSSPSGLSPYELLGLPHSLAAGSKCQHPVLRSTQNHLHHAVWAKAPTKARPGPGQGAGLEDSSG